MTICKRIRAAILWSDAQWTKAERGAEMSEYALEMAHDVDTDALKLAILRDLLVKIDARQLKLVWLMFGQPKDEEARRVRENRLRELVKEWCRTHECVLKRQRQGTGNNKLCNPRTNKTIKK